MYFLFIVTTHTIITHHHFLTWTFLRLRVTIGSIFLSGADSAAGFFFFDYDDWIKGFVFFYATSCSGDDSSDLSFLN